MGNDNLFDDIGDFFDGEEGPSKSQLKRDMHALQDLGEALTQLSPHELEKIELPETLRDAIEKSFQITSRVAKRRHLQFIGRIMRDLDPEPIQRELDTLKKNARFATQQHHQVELWRDRILSEGDSAINAFMEQYPDTDRQKLRQFERAAKKEAELNKPPTAARTLFKYLRELMSEEQA